jgi:hypothetical protein
MTDTEWLECMDPNKMLAFLDGKSSNRKLWLFACGGCRRHTDLLADRRCRAAVEAGERYADGEASYDERTEASEEAFCRRADLTGDKRLEAIAIAAAFSVVDPGHWDSALPPITTAEAVGRTSEDLIHLAELSVATVHYGETMEKGRQQAADLERAAQCNLLRCVIGNPFRPLVINPSWRAPSVVHLAGRIYEDRAFDRMPELADALEIVGCENLDILAHCREAREHVRGCWVVDMLLGKE